MSMLTRFAALGGAPAQTYVDDVFSAHLYTGNGSTQTITTGIDTLNGGTIWFKGRQSLAGGNNNQIIMPDPNPSNDLFLDTASTAGTSGTTSLSRTTTGFTLNAAGSVNFNTQTFVARSFKKASKFFDVVTYTGNGSSTQSIAHALGVAPGLVITKSTGVAGSWGVAYLRGNVGSGGIIGFGLESTAAMRDTGNAIGTRFTSTTFDPYYIPDAGANVGGQNINAQTYVAYLFAHDAAAEGLIQCGTFTTDGSGNATVTSLGWEPQFLLVKASSTTGDWIMLDTIRGWNMTAADARLLANSSGAESTATDYGNPTATGFSFSGGSASATYIYMAIRRPNKPPTSGSQVFLPTTNTAIGSSDWSASPLSEKSFDTILSSQRASSAGFRITDRLRGLAGAYSTTNTRNLLTYNTDAETSSQYPLQLGDTAGTIDTGLSGGPGAINYLFKRAPGFFDVVCYTGTGAQLSVTHNLGAVPELIIVKRRDIASPSNGWPVWTGVVDQPMWLNLALSRQTFFNTFPVAPTSSVFTVGTNADNGAAGGTYVAYLFASLTGISKVGTYTGNGGTAGTNGTSQTINCGFTAGARFVLVKRTNSTGDWYVFDSARGIVAASDPYLLMNSTAAEVTTVDAVDADNSGFIVNQTSGTNLNVTSATYIYLAIA